MRSSDVKLIKKLITSINIVSTASEEICSNGLPYTTWWKIRTQTPPGKLYKLNVRGGGTTICKKTCHGASVNPFKNYLNKLCSRLVCVSELSRSGDSTCACYVGVIGTIGLTL